MTSSEAWQPIISLSSPTTGMQEGSSASPLVLASSNGGGGGGGGGGEAIYATANIKLMARGESQPRNAPMKILDGRLPTEKSKRGRSHERLQSVQHIPSSLLMPQPSADGSRGRGTPRKAFREGPVESSPGVSNERFGLGADADVSNERIVKGRRLSRPVLKTR